MPDSPDYQKYLPNSNRFSLSDLGEHAVRLGAPSIFDRRGEVVWQTNFTDGFSRVNLQLGNAGSSISIIAGEGHQSPYFSRMITGAVNGSQVFIFRYIDVPQLSSIGMEVGIRPYTNFGRVTLSFQVASPTRVSSAFLRFTHSTKSLSVIDSGSNFIDVASVIYTPNSLERFINIKLVMDVVNGIYRRLMVGPNEYNTSSISCINSGGTTLHRLYMYVTLENVAASSGTVDLSHIIITANEP